MDALPGIYLRKGNSDNFLNSKYDEPKKIRYLNIATLHI